MTNTHTTTTTKTNHYFRAMLTMLAMLAAMLVAGGAALAATTTFGNSSPIQIVDGAAAVDPANPYPSQINVQGLSGSITDINLKLNGFTYPEPNDVDVIVQHGDQSAIVMSDVLSYSDTTNDVDLILDDEAANPLPSTRSDLPSGSYKPTDNDPVEDLVFPSPANTLPTDGAALSAFDNTDPNGTWNLYVVDDANFYQGGFAGGWSLDITTGSTTPSPDPQPGPQPDTTAPRVTSTTPAPRATGVSPTVNVTAAFSEDMQATTVNAQTFELFQNGSTTRLTATVSYDAATDKATLDPAGSLKSGVTYKAVIITSAKDLAGNALDQNPTKAGNQPKEWRFKVQ